MVWGWYCPISCTTALADRPRTHFSLRALPCPAPRLLPQVVQNPQGRTVMVELAGAAAKEAAAGVSAALADRFRLEWMLLAALAMLLVAWLLQRIMAALLG